MGMLTTRNVGTIDRVLRIVIGAALVLAAWRLALPTWGAVLLAVAGVMTALTGATGSCSIYYMLGISTRPADRRGVSH